MTEPKKVLVGRRYVDEAVAHLRELVEDRAVAVALALDKQATEYERRLEDLNDAHARAIEAANRTVPRDLYDANREDEAGRREDLARQFQAAKDANVLALTALREDLLKDVQFRAGEAKAKATVYAVVVSLAGVVLSWILRGGTP